jgi:hypothetical protein
MFVQESVNAQNVTDTIIRTLLLKNTEFTARLDMSGGHVKIL